MRSSSFPPAALSYSHHNLRITSVGLVILARWLAPPVAEDVRLMRVALRPFVSRHDRFCSMNIIDIEHATPMGEDARFEVAQTQREFEARQIGLANVIEGRGFYAAAIRSVASGLGLLSRVKFEQKIFDTVEPAAYWLASLFPVAAVDVPGVVRGAAMLRLEET